MADVMMSHSRAGVDDVRLEDRHVASGWYGIWWLICTEACLFAFLLFAYVYSMLQVGQSWPDGGLPSLKLALPNTIILLASSFVLWFGERAGRRDNEPLELGLLILGIVMGIAFVVIQGFEWHDKTFGLTTDLYGSFYFTVTGFHMAHVVVGILVLTGLAAWMVIGPRDALGPSKKLHQRPFGIAILYWHFVDVVWLFVFTTFYLAPYWSGAS